MKMKSFFSMALMGIFALVVASCEKSDSNALDGSLPVTRTANDGLTTFRVNNIWSVLQATNPLTEDEVEFLYALREDEKLAADLYYTFGLEYPEARQFIKWYTAEETHIAAIEAVLEYYEIEFPAIGEIGVFADADRQAYYNELVSNGITLLDAYMVAAALEEENIVIYTEVMENSSNNNIILLLENLIESSWNHLKMLVNHIENEGGSYVPAIMDEDLFNEIIDSSYCQGKEYNMQGGKGGKASCKNSEKNGTEKGCKATVDKSGNCKSASGGSGSGNTGGKGKGCKGYRGGNK